MQTMIIFTAKSVDTILQEGGSAAWRLDRNHARQCDYAVCTRNAYSDWGDGTEPHHTGFLVGKIRDVVPAADRPDRFLIQFSEYARINVPDAWVGGRNPVRYGDLESLGIDPSTLTWEAMPEPTVPATVEPVHSNEHYSLTLAQAKEGLAATLGVSPDAIEITIRC